MTLRLAVLARASVPLVLSVACAGSGGPTAILPPGPTEGYVALALGVHHSCGIRSGEGTFCRGRNRFGQLGDGTLRNSPRAVAVAGAPAFASLSLGSHHSCGLTAMGAAFCWGANAGGALGTGNTESSFLPIPVSGGLVFRALSAGGASTCGLDASGRAWCWGANGSGQLGNGTQDNLLEPPMKSS